MKCGVEADCNGARAVLCAAIVNGDLFISSRTERDCDSTVKILRKTLNGLGGAGGRRHRAGVKMPNVGHSEKATDEMRDELRTRWLASCNVTRKCGSRLIAKREIVENLE